jgi:hypothetical protein
MGSPRECFTIEEAAKELDVQREDIIRMFVNGMNGWAPLLKPSVYFPAPIQMFDISEYKEDCLVNKIDPLDFEGSTMPASGFFQIRNYAGILHEIEDDSGYLNLADVPLFAGGKAYLIQGAARIHKNGLVIEVDEFNGFKTAHGIVEPVTGKVQAFDIGKYVEEMRRVTSPKRR